MNKYSTALAVLVMAALSAPVVCQAQDPAAEFKVVQQLAGAGKTADALARCDNMLNVFSNPKSRVAAQFRYFAPFFQWQKAQLLFSSADYEGAYLAFKELSENKDYQKADLRDRAKAQVPGGYDAFLTTSLFYMGFSRFQQALGTKEAPGDPKLYEECIPVLEKYLQLYQSGKVSDMEKKQKLDGKLCFILLQAYILKPQPDFQKAGEYLEKSRTAKASLPDEMAMTGLGTVIDVALKNPQYIDWGHKVLSSNPSSFQLGPVRLARYGGQFFNFGNSSSKVIDASLKEGKLAQAAAAARTTFDALGMVPDTAGTILALKEMSKALGSFKSPVRDAAVGAVYLGSDCTKLAASYSKFLKNNTQLESYAVSTAANAALQFGSNRLAKAGYQILLDRYPKMSMNSNGSLQPLKDKNYFQYAQLCRATGDEETAVRYEKMIDGESLGEGGQAALLVNKMARLTSEGNWAEAIPAAEEVVNSPEVDKKSQNYVAAKFTIVASNYKLRQFDKVAKEGVALLESGLIDQVKEAGKLKENVARTYDSQTRYFVIDAFNKLGASDMSNYDKAMDQVNAFIVKYPSNLDVKANPMIPNVYYMGVDTLLKRRGKGDPAADAKDLSKALDYCAVIAEKWPDHALYPTSRLLAGNILVNGEDEARKDEGIRALEECAEAALKQTDGKGKGIAANALFWLASYTPDIEREGEDEAARSKRVSSYIARFWAEADSEGDPYCLQMLNLSMKHASDKASFETEVKRAEEVIAREANLALSNSVQNPEMEGAINSFVANYVEGYKEYNKKDMTLEEKSELFANFPGISKEDKYTQAILRMAMLNSMSEAMAAAKRKDADPETVKQLEREINDTFAKMKKDFDPSQLTNFICVQVGNFAVNYAKSLPDAAARNADLTGAIAYFDTVLNRGQDNISQAKLGKADALSLMNDKAKMQGAVELYKSLSNDNDRDVMGPALYGLTKVHMALGNYKEAVDVADKFTSNRGLSANRADVFMLQGQAYAKSGDIENALLTYTNLYNQNRGKVAYSAPACRSMMELYWDRNKPSTGDRLKGTFKSSDRWRAWSVGQDYVTSIRRSGIEQKMTPDDRDKFNEVVKLVAQYASHSAVQHEDKDKKNFEAMIKSGKSK